MQIELRRDNLNETLQGLFDLEEISLDNIALNEILKLGKRRDITFLRIEKKYFADVAPNQGSEPKYGLKKEYEVIIEGKAYKIYLNSNKLP